MTIIEKKIYSCNWPLYSGSKNSYSVNYWGSPWMGVRRNSNTRI